MHAQNIVHLPIVNLLYIKPFTRLNDVSTSALSLSGKETGMLT